MATKRNDFSNPVAIEEGGTGATTVNDARNALGITIGARTIQGTPEEIVVTDGDGVLGNPIVSLALDPVCPGASSLSSPVGTSAQRPASPVEGMIRGNTDLGFTEVYSDGDWRPMGREIQGTPAQIQVVDGDGIAGDPTISLPENVTFPGTGAVIPPTGTTAERPGIPVNGMIRANSDSNALEAYSNGTWVDLGTGGVTPPFFNNYLTGLINTVASVTDMTFSEGQCTESTNSQLLNNNSVITKQINANWVEGDAVGGFPSSLTLTANTVYYTFLIGKPDGTVDFGFDDDLTAANLLFDAAGDGYTLYRRIGSCRTQSGSTDLETIYQIGDYFYYEEQKEDFTVSLPGSSIVDNVVPLSVPSSIDIVINVFATTFREGTGASEDSKAYILPTTSPGTANNYLSHINDAGGNTASGSSSYQVPSIDGTVRHYAVSIGGGAAGTSYVSTLGWNDGRGK